MDNIEKVEIFKNLLSSLMFSQMFQFKYNGIIEFYTSSTGDNYKSKFSNELRSIKINIRLAFENDVSERMSITIFKEDEVGIDDEPYFLLTEWLDSSGREENEWKKFYLNAYQGSFEEKLKAFFEYINGLFEDEELSKVLRGETWMNFGFDWRGMK